MKICYLANGNSIHTQKWVNFFANKGHEVYLISLRANGADNLQKIKLYPLKLIRTTGTVELPHSIRLMNFPWVIIQVKRIIKKIRPDILHAHYATDYGFMGALSSFHPFVLTAWGSDILFGPQESSFQRWAVRFTLKRADSITCDADHLTDAVVDLGAIAEKIELIHFGIDTDRFKARPKNETLLAKLQLAPNTPTVISLRSLNPIYDLESLIKATPLILAQVPETKFIIVGDGEQKAYLKELAVSLGVEGKINFVGLIPNNELTDYLSLADVYVSTSLSDAGLASSTAEAMACELPVVITNFGDNPKWVNEGQGGFLVPLKSPVALAEKVSFLLKDEETRKKFGQINRSIIEERNDYYREMKKVECIYQTLIEGSKS
ncbi:MAG: glycosyltransferase [Anaerolineae bacterium]|nr:glycosyltransferase [Anaerolineae bacterium]